jgi:hypothetical protein
MDATYIYRSRLQKLLGYFQYQHQGEYPQPGQPYVAQQALGQGLRPEQGQQQQGGFLPGGQLLTEQHEHDAGQQQDEEGKQLLVHWSTGRVHNRVGWCRKERKKSASGPNSLFTTENRTKRHFLDESNIRIIFHIVHSIIVTYRY